LVKKPTRTYGSVTQVTKKQRLWKI